MEPGRRAELVSQQRHGAAPLFAACARGNLACAEYLLHVCGAELEQRGQYRAPGSSELHNVTPLWAAAVSGTESDSPLACRPARSDPSN